MTLRIIQVNTTLEFSEILTNIVKNTAIHDSWRVINKHENELIFSMLVPMERTQEILDILHSTFINQPTTRIVILPITATLPKEEVAKEREERFVTGAKGVIAREELYNTVTEGARLDRNFLLLVVLSTVVAALGLLENNIAVIIGAMVIAPLLGPNLALSLATTLGDVDLMMQAVKTTFAAIATCLLITFVVGLFWPYGFHSTELILRTDVGYDGVVLAFVSGAAAALSLTTGLSSVLVGVMVAVALLPPLSTVGIMLGAGMYRFATGALLLFAVNIVCVNLAANLVFLFKGIRPTRWYEKQKAKKATFWQILFWTVILLLLALTIYLRHGLSFIE